MSFTAVIFGIDDPFGYSLCRAMLENGGIVFGGTAATAAPAIAGLATEFPESFRAIAMDPRSADSLKPAVEEIGSINVDLIVSNVDSAAYEKDDVTSGFDTMKQVYDIDALGPIRFVEAFLPLMSAGMKRLCFVTNEKGSLGMRPAGNAAKSGFPALPLMDFAYSMSKTALNRSVMIMFNNLRRDGFTFRLLIPKAGNASAACDYFLKDRDDEFRLTIVDDEGNEWPY